MRFLIPICIALLPVFGLFRLNAQTTVFEERFDNCALPASWQVNLSGNPNAKWLVGFAQNSVVPGQSIDSTCCLFIDDYATGNNTPGYILEFVSPAFNIAGYQTAELSMDVHYRHNNSTDQYFDVLITDGTTEQLITRFNSGHSNEANSSVSKHFSLRFDLALLTKKTGTRLIFRYNDSAGEWGWWAGIDNIRVVGSGTGTNVLTEAFNNCAQPAGWTTEILTGNNNWSFGLVPFGSSAYYGGTSMDGSCFAFFDDNKAGENAPPSKIRLLSPWFSGTEFFRYELAFDLIMRYSGDAFQVFVENDKGDKFPLLQKEAQIGGPFFPNYIHYKFDLTPYRSGQLRIGFEYDDKGLWGYWNGLDNVKVTGAAAALDFCAQAETLLTGDPCHPAENRTALFNGPAPDCSGRVAGGLWFQWLADFTGIAQLVTNATFNDVVSVYTGDCAALQPVLCNNRDEHGFTGETTYIPVQEGTRYYFHISGQEDGFGISRGDVCVGIDQAGGYPPRPVNDDCATALPLPQDGSCIPGNNHNALMSSVLPSGNQLARADVWYSFTAGNPAPGEVQVLESNANFSDIITLYEGTCNALTELACNHKGGSLSLPALSAGETYYVQIAGTFASVEGQLCPRLSVVQPTTPPNDDCFHAEEIVLGGNCVAANNTGASFSGLQPACAVSVDHDIWFKFTAPAFGAVRINTGASFEHTLSVWRGPCDSLKSFFCTLNPLRCDGYVTVGSLTPGETYFVQIASWKGPGGIRSGNMCVKILDGQSAPDFTPLHLEVLQPCIGTDSARLYITASGGLPPYTFLADTSGQIVLSGQPFAVIVSDLMGCETEVFDSIEPCASNTCTAKVTLTPTLPTCFGDSDGIVKAEVNGNGGPLFFKWSNNTFTSTNMGLAAGTYTLTITELSGCVYVASIVLPQPDAIQIQADSIRQPVQGQNDGAISVTVTGATAPLTYYWVRDGLLFAQDTEDLDNLAGGTYELLVTDSSGCTGTFSAQLTETVGTDAPKEPFRAALYPNPANKETILSVSLPAPEKLYISLTDALGRLVLNREIGNIRQQQISLDVQALPPGVYRVQVRTAQHSLARNLIVWR